MALVWLASVLISIRWIKEVILENRLNSFEYLLSVDAVLVLGFSHVKPLAAVWLVVVDVERVPFEGTVIKLPDDK